MLYHFTHVDYASQFALVAVIGENGRDAIIAVARYAYDPHNHITDLALAVRDDWQNLGLGKSLLEKIVAIGKEHGITRFGSMMDPGNHAIEQILKAPGYQVKYSLRNGFYQVEIFV
jgi:acetyltransferase